MDGREWQAVKLWSVENLESLDNMYCELGARGVPIGERYQWLKFQPEAQSTILVPHASTN